jgi:hypothetical protein
MQGKNKSLTVTERILWALKEIGKPATTGQVVQITGLTSSQAGCTLWRLSQQKGGDVYRQQQPGQRAWLYYISERQRDLIAIRPLPKTELPWHERKIKEYGLEKWSGIVNRDFEDFRRKLGIAG